MRDSEPAADRLAYRNAAGRHRFALLLEHERGHGAISPTEIGIALSSPTRFEGRRTRLVKEQWTFRMSSSWGSTPEPQKIPSFHIVNVNRFVA